MKLHPGLKDMIKTRALSLRLRFFDTMTDKAALKQATKEELALEPRDWSWWRPPSRKQIKHAAAELTRLLNQPPPEPPFIIRTRAAAEPAVNKVKKKQSITQRLAAAVSTSMSTSPTPPLVPGRAAPGGSVSGARTPAPR